MSVILSPETEKLIEDRMKWGGFSTPDELVRAAIEIMAFDEGDEETLAAIERAEAQSDRGEGRPWEEVREEICARFGLK